MKSDNKIGILDPSGLNRNPFTNNEYSEEYKLISKQWTSLPAYVDAVNIINTIQTNQVTLVISGTGSGKTVLIPKYAAHVFDYKKKIAVTLPKRITTKAAAEYSAKTLDVKLGEEVGYVYKGSPPEFNSELTKILYATDGTIVAKLLNDPLLEDIDCVIIDEAHERKITIDFLMFLLKKCLHNRPEFKCIIMSATINSEIFVNYFKEFNFKIVDISGKSNYPIESIYLNKSTDKYIDEGFKIIGNIIKNGSSKCTPDAKTSCDILFFVPAISETYKTCNKIINELHGFCIEMHSGMNPIKQALAQDKDAYKIQLNVYQKIVVSTNVAESSLTIDGIKYIIDSGLEYKSYYDINIRARALDKQLISQAQIKQRMGRSGRTGPGICYHLYTREDYNKTNKYPKSEIITHNIYEEFLKLLGIYTTVDKVTTVLSEFIEAPLKSYVNVAIDQLMQLDLIDKNKISKLGLAIIKLKMDPMVGVALYTAYHFNCLNEVLILFIIIDKINSSLTNFFEIPKNKKDLKLFNAFLKKISSKYGDHITLLKIYLKYHDFIQDKQNDKNAIKKWLEDNYIDNKIFEGLSKNYHKYKHKYAKIFNEIGKSNNLGENEPDEYKIIAAIYSGFRLNTASFEKKTFSTKYTSHINPPKLSFVHYGKNNIYIYHELFKINNKKTLNIITELPDDALNLYLKYRNKLLE